MDILGELTHNETAQYHKNTIMEKWLNNRNKGKHALLKIVLILYKWRLIYLLFLSIIIAAIDSFEPLLLKEVIAYFESENQEDSKNRTLFYAV